MWQILGIPVLKALGFAVAGWGLKRAGELLAPEIEMPETERPNISEIEVPTSEYGLPIPKVFGTCMVHGTVLVAGELEKEAVVENVPKSSVTTVNPQSPSGGQLVHMFDSQGNEYVAERGSAMYQIAVERGAMDPNIYLGLDYYGNPINGSWSDSYQGTYYSQGVTSDNYSSEEQEFIGNSKTVTTQTDSINKITFAMALCEGPIDNLIHLFKDSVSIYSGGAYEGDLTLNGQQVDLCRLFRGTFTQSADIHLQDIGGATPKPAYRGISYIIFQGWDLSEGLYMDNLSFVVKCPTPRYDYIGSDVNPMGIIYYILTEALKISESMIDMDNFDEVAHVLEDEGLGVSIAMTSQREASSWIEEVLKHCDGILYLDIFTGKLKVTLIRDDYDVDLLDEYDDTVISNFSIERDGWQNIANMISLTYTDGSEAVSLYKPSTLTMINSAARDMAGMVVQENISLMGITQPDVAKAVLQRLVIKKGFPLSQCKFDMSYTEGKSISIGDVIKLNYSRYGITNLVLRVMDMEIDDGSNYDSISFTCIEDIFGTAQIDLSVPDAPSYTPPSYTVNDFVEATVIDTPSYFTDQRAVFVCPVKNSDLVDEAWLYLSEDAGANYFKKGKIFINYCGRLVGTYSADTYDMDRDGSFIVEDIYGLNTLSTLSEENFQKREYQALLGNEFISFGSITDIGGGQYRIENIIRKEHFSTQQAHVDGEIFYMINKPAQLDFMLIGAIENNIRVKIVPKLPFEDTVKDERVASALVKSYTFLDKVNEVPAPQFIIAERTGFDVELIWNFPSMFTGACYNYPAFTSSYARYGYLRNGYFVLTYTDNGTTYNKWFVETKASITTVDSSVSFEVFAVINGKSGPETSTTI